MTTSLDPKKGGDFETGYGETLKIGFVSKPFVYETNIAFLLDLLL